MTWDEVNQRWLRHMVSKNPKTGMQAGVWRGSICGSDDRNVTSAQRMVTCPKCLEILKVQNGKI